jgi:hypothetical protein
MAYRSHYRAKPKPRAITVKYQGQCVCCGALIKAGELATYYPVGTIYGVDVGKIGHLGGLDGNSAVCTANLRREHHLDDAITWPNGEGFTPCTRAYAELCDKLAALKPETVNLDDLSPDDYNEFCALSHRRDQMQAEGHLGQSVRHDDAAVAAYVAEGLGER